MTQRTHCRHGHELTPENVYVHPKDGRRECRACRRVVVQRRYESTLKGHNTLRVDRRGVNKVRP